METEIPISFNCENDRLYGILHQPREPAPRGVLVVVGGPQYRVGSHRQFILLARDLADEGIPVLRFDYRSLGDSEGDNRNFEEINSDIHSAIDVFFDKVPTLKEVVIWGLCDAASAAVFYASGDKRVTGIVLLNPWVRTEAGIAKAYLKYYYMSRLIDPNFWNRICRGEFNLIAALHSFLTLVRISLGFKQGEYLVDSVDHLTDLKNRPAAKRTNEDLPTKMFNGLRLFKGRVLLILSGNDLTAGEFKGAVAKSRAWQKLLKAPRITRRDLPAANHTFSHREWRNQVTLWTKEWVQAG